MVNSINKSRSVDGIKLEVVDLDAALLKENYRRGDGQRSFSINEASSESMGNFDLSSDSTRSDPYSSEESKDESIGDSCSRRRISRLTKKLSSSRTSYGLRPREELRKPSYDFDFDEKDPPEEVVAPLSSRRPHRRQGRRNNLQSKYRRKTANARERHRMKEINDAFTTLRGILPPMTSRKAAQVSMTKIRILRYATSYIEALSELLTEADSGIKGATLSSYSEPFFAGIQFRPTEDRFAPKMEEPDFKCDIERTKVSSDGGGVDPPNSSGERELTSCEGDIIAFLEGAANINESFNTTLEELYFSLS